MMSSHLRRPYPQSHPLPHQPKLPQDAEPVTDNLVQFVLQTPCWLNYGPLDLATVKNGSSNSYHSTPQVSLPNSAHILCALSTIKSKPASKNVVPGRQPPKPPNPDKASTSTLDFCKHLPATNPNLIRSPTASSHQSTDLPATYLWLINSPVTCGSSFV